MNTNSQDEADYGFGWSQFNSNYTPSNGYESMYEAFQFRDAHTLGGSSISGQFYTYDGSGYLYQMRGDINLFKVI